MECLDPSALDQLKGIVSVEHLSFADNICDLLARTTLPEGTRPIGVVRPADADQVQDIMRWANQWKVPVYPISTGKNWGYGDACAPQERALILDLGRMNRILEVNSELAYAVIEPGVTQGQLDNYLDQNAIPLMMDGNGAGPDTSLIGNILDRGFGHSRYGDRSMRCCNFEAVLADGSLIRSGYGAIPNSRVQHLEKWGNGPSLDGLFKQSKLAVITRLTLWLMPKPACTNYFFITFNDKAAIGSLIDRFRPLYLNGTLRSVIHCANEGRFLASSTCFPWEEADGTQALEVQNPNLFKKLCRRFDVEAWSISGALTGWPWEVAAARKTVQKALHGTGGVKIFFFMGPRLHACIVHLRRWLTYFHIGRLFAKKLERLEWVVQLLEGHPSYGPLQSAHWRARGQRDHRNNPLDSGAGLIWINCMLPMRSSDVEELNGVSERIIHSFGFEFQITLLFIPDRSLCAMMSITYDRQSPDETQRARQCEEAITLALLAKGFSPYRTSARQQKLMGSRIPAQEAYRRIKEAWDPNHIIAPSD